MLTLQVVDAGRCQKFMGYRQRSEKSARDKAIGKVQDRVKTLNESGDTEEKVPFAIWLLVSPRIAVTAW